MPLHEIIYTHTHICTQQHTHSVRLIRFVSVYLESAADMLFQRTAQDTDIARSRMSHHFHTTWMQ